MTQPRGTPDVPNPPTYGLLGPRIPGWFAEVSTRLVTIWDDAWDSGEQGRRQARFTRTMAHEPHQERGQESC